MKKSYKGFIVFLGMLTLCSNLTIVASDSDKVSLSNDNTRIMSAINYARRLISNQTPKIIAIEIIILSAIFLRTVMSYSDQDTQDFVVDAQDLAAIELSGEEFADITILKNIVWNYWQRATKYGQSLFSMQSLQDNEESSSPQISEVD